MGLSESHGDAPEPVVEKISLLQQCMAAGGASIVSALVVNPLDVVKVQWAAVWVGMATSACFGDVAAVREEVTGMCTMMASHGAPTAAQILHLWTLNVPVTSPRPRHFPQTRLQIQRSPTHSVSAYAQEHALLE